VESSGLVEGDRAFGIGHVTLGYRCFFRMVSLVGIRRGGCLGCLFCGGGEVDGGLSGRVIAPGDYGVEVVDEVLGETRGEGFAA